MRIPTIISSRSPSSLQAVTLNEILVIIAIIAILAVLIFPTINTVSGKWARARCILNLKNVAATIKIYILDFKSMPDDGSAAVNTAYQSNAADKKDGTGVNKYLDLLYTQGLLHNRKTVACADPARGTEESVINTYTYIYRSVDIATAASAVAVCPLGNKHGRPRKVTPTAYYGGYAEIRDKALDKLPIPSTPAGW